MGGDVVSAAAPPDAVELPDEAIFPGDDAAEGGKRRTERPHGVNDDKMEKWRKRKQPSSVGETNLEDEAMLQRMGKIADALDKESRREKNSRDTTQAKVKRAQAAARPQHLRMLDLCMTGARLKRKETSN